MALPRVFIDGHVGTTGLRIREWLSRRDDLELLSLDESLRKDRDARRETAGRADLVILCLPDAASRESMAWLDASGTRVIDSSTAFRVDDDWVYGLVELEKGQRAAIRDARWVSNPGCYATGVILLLRPLIVGGLLPADAPISIHALSGYSGGGRPLIERWEDPDRDLLGLTFEAPYALDRVHKHIPEITTFSGLEQTPVFIPAVGPFRTGLRVEIPLHQSLLSPGASPKAIWEALDLRYRDEPFVRVAPLHEEIQADERSLDPRALDGTNLIEISAFPNPAGHVLLVARLDNLGKGASGMAIQSMNLMLGLEETRGLTSR